jgi:peptide/nickel transport system permease protein
MATAEAVVERGTPAEAAPARSPAAAAWRRLVASPAARAGLVMVVVFVAIAVLTPVMHSYEARTDANLTARLKAPTTAHPFGTDSLGRDIMVRVLHATRVSLGLAISAVAVAALIGAGLGFVAGYVRGRLDLVVMFCMDIVLAFPATLLAIAIVAMIGPGLRNSLFAISLVSIPAYARLSRSSVLALREQ